MMDTRQTVLWVEDDKDEQLIMGRLIQGLSLAFDLAIVDNGEDALRYLKREGAYSQAGPCALVLLDLNLPRVDGREVLRKVKQDAGLQHIPVVIFTTSEQEEDIIQSYRNGAAAYITKPVDLDEYSKILTLIDTFYFKLARLPVPRNRS